MLRVLPAAAVLDRQEIPAGLSQEFVKRYRWSMARGLRISLLLFCGSPSLAVHILFLNHMVGLPSVKMIGKRKGELHEKIACDLLNHVSAGLYACLQLQDPGASRLI